MGVASFLLSVWRAAPPPPPPPPPSSHKHSASSATVADPLSSTLSQTRPPRRPPHVSFTLPDKLYSWLQAMALVHNCGSVHKSVRDLISWAETAQEDDLDWLFSIPHNPPLDEPPPTPPPSPTHDAISIAERQQAHACFLQQFPSEGTTTSFPSDMVVLHAIISHAHYGWISSVVSRYALPGPSAVLDALCRVAIELGAAEDVFESDECGHDLPASTAELYHDLGLLSFAPAPSPSSFPPSCAAFPMPPHDGGLQHTPTSL